MKQIGIMGGTFDPIHVGHLMLGRQAFEEYGLDSVWYMPSKTPPHNHFFQRPLCHGVGGNRRDSIFLPFRF